MVRGPTRADVDVPRHQHDALREERAAASDTGRDDAHAGRWIDPLDRDLVEVAESADVHRLDLAQAEVERIAFFAHSFTIQPSGPGSATRSLPRSRRVDRRLDRLALEVAALPPLDGLSELGHRTSSRSSTARMHSSSVGTSA